MLIDVHCHLFTKKVLTQGLTRLENYLTQLEKVSIPASKIAPEDFLKFSDTAFDFANKAVQLTPLEMYEDMRSGYGEDLIIVPLMVDFSYTFLAPKDKVLENKKSLLSTMKKASKKSREKVMNDWLNELAVSVEKKLDTYDRSVVLLDFFKNSYEEQIKDLSLLKSQLGDKVFPFFSIDPRRNEEFEQGILGEIKKYVGKDKIFAGLKLYTSLGYSPTHPVLYDDSESESVYAYCEKHEIPITVHASLEGFSHMLDKNYVEGDIYYAPAGQAVPADDVFEDGVVSYKNNLYGMAFSDLTRERLLTLNHPTLWEKVLEKYPNLKLNLAHFGGILQMTKLVNGNKTGFYAGHIINMMKKYKNVYTDMACLYNFSGEEGYMDKIYECVYAPLPEELKDRVMFGSDYYMLCLFNTTLDDYITAFKSAFGSEFIRISEVNSLRFLFG